MADCHSFCIKKNVCRSVKGSRGEKRVRQVRTPQNTDRVNGSIELHTVALVADSIIEKATSTILPWLNRRYFDTVHGWFAKQSYVFQGLHAASIPELQRTSLAPVILQLKALGVDNVLRFNFPAPPPSESMSQGLELLYGLGALDENGGLTEPLGLQMAELPFQPMLAKMVLGAQDYGCMEEALSIAAMLQVEQVFVRPSRGEQKVNAERCRRKFSVLEGDHVTLLNVYTAFVKYGKSSQWCRQNFLHYKGLCRAVEIRRQLELLLKRMKVKTKNDGGRPNSVNHC